MAKNGTVLFDWFVLCPKAFDHTKKEPQGKHCTEDSNWRENYWEIIDVFAFVDSKDIRLASKVNRVNGLEILDL